MHDASDPPHLGDRRSATRLAVVAGGFVAVLVLLQLYLAVVKVFDPDEWLAMHGAWLIAQGQVPYRDYFEHHGPLFHGVMAVLYWATHPERTFASAYAVIVASRLWMITWLGLALTLVWHLAARWRGRTVAWVALALLVSHLTYMEKMLEVRPDVFFQVFWLGALLGLTTVLKDPSRRNVWFGVGLLMGAALTTSVKLLVTGPALVAGLAVGFWPQLRSGDRWQIVRGIAVLVGGAAVSLGAVAAWFAAHGALKLAWSSNFARNLAWVFHSTPWEYVSWVLVRNPAFVVLAVAGLVGARRDVGGGLDRPLWLWTVGTMAGVFAMPVVQRQEYLLFLPLCALFAAEALVTIAERSGDLPPRVVNAGAIGVIVALTALGYWGWDPFPFSIDLDDSTAYHGFGVVWQLLTMVGLVVVLLRPRRSLLLCLLPALANPLPIIATARLSTAAKQLRGIELVMREAAPTETVLEAWTGYGVFRPHAQRHFFLHQEIQAMLGQPYMRRMMADLRSCKLAPKVVVYDWEMSLLTATMGQVVHAHYRAADPVDRMVLVRRPKPLSEDRFKLKAADRVDPIAVARLREAWQVPGTDAAMVVACRQLTGDGITWRPHAIVEQDVLVTLRHRQGFWEVLARFPETYFVPWAQGNVAWWHDGQWETRALPGRQDRDGNWVMRTDFPDGEPLPPWLLVHPRFWSEWYVVGLPVQPTVGGPGAALPRRQAWQPWPRRANGDAVPATAPGAAPGILNVTSWLPLDASVLPLDLPGNAASNPWFAADPWRVRRTGFAAGQTGVEAFVMAAPGTTWEAAGPWVPEQYRLLPHDAGKHVRVLPLTGPRARVVD